MASQFSPKLQKGSVHRKFLRQSEMHLGNLKVGGTILAKTQVFPTL